MEQKSQEPLKPKAVNLAVLSARIDYSIQILDGLCQVLVKKGLINKEELDEIIKETLDNMNK